MAIYHLNSKVIMRSHNGSSIEAAAYISACKLEDKMKRVSFDYRKKHGVVFSKILAPENSPAWVYDRNELWNKVEESEKRRDAQVARSITVALPKELGLEQQKELLFEFIKKSFINKGMISDFSIHFDNSENPHAHILLTMRSLNGVVFGSKVRAWNSTDILVGWRKGWADMVNHHLNLANLKQRVDHRSYIECGIKKKPTIHLGRKNHYALKFRKVELDRCKVNENIYQKNRVSANNDSLKENSEYLNRYGFFSRIEKNRKDFLAHSISSLSEIERDEIHTEKP